MSIDAVMEAADAYAAQAPKGWDADSLRLYKALCEEVRRYVAEAVKAEREEILDLVDAYAKNNADLKAAIRARAEKEVTK